MPPVSTQTAFCYDSQHFLSCFSFVSRLVKACGCGSEGEGEAFEEDVARIEREKKEAAAAGGTASHGSSAQPQSGSGSNYFVLVAAVVLALSSCAWLLMHQSELVV